MSIRAVVLLTALVCGLFFVMGFCIDWTPDLTKEEMFGRPAVPKMPPDMLGPGNPKAIQQQALNKIREDMVESIGLAENQDLASARRLVNLLQAYPPVEFTSPALRRPGMEAQAQEAHEIITQCVIDSTNPYLFDVLLADKPITKSDELYYGRVAEILAARRDENALRAIYNLLQTQGQRPGPQQEMILEALGTFAGPELLELARADLDGQDEVRKDLAVMAVRLVKTPQAADVGGSPSE